MEPKEYWSGLNDPVSLFVYKTRNYQDYEILKWYVFRDDDFTCQECGRKNRAIMYQTFGCALLPDWFDQFAVLNRHPTFCPAMDELGYKTLKECRSFSIVNNKVIPHNKIPVVSCVECPYFAVYNWEDYDDSDLVMHHRDFNPKNNERKNLMTLCKKCNGLKKYSNSNLEKTRLSGGGE